MGTHVLIVDDEFGLADVIAEVLTEAGYDTAIAINGELALRRMAERRPDLVVLDLMMPILDGPGTLRRMKADANLATIPVILMTAIPQAAADATLSDRYDGFLRKPFMPRALLETVRSLLEG